VFDTFAGMRSREEYEEVTRLVATGMNDSAISRATGVPRPTVRDWRTGKGDRTETEGRIEPVRRVMGHATCERSE
jgi:hypothetical protein